MADTEDGSNYLKAYILLMYYIVVGLLAVVGNLSANADMKPILSMLTPHLLYIPLVLTALWYPKEKFIHISIFIVFIFVSLLSFLIGDLGADVIFSIFISLIYLWVYFAIILFMRKRNTAEESVRAELDMVKAQLRSRMDSEDPAGGAGTAGGAGGTPVRGVGSGSVAVAETAYVIGRGKNTETFAPEQIKALISSFDVRDPLILEGAFNAAEVMGRQAEPYLIEGLGSQSLPVRENCARMLGRLKYESSIPHLIEALNENSKRMHAAAVSALANIGPAAKEALIIGLKDPSYKVRAGCCEALRIIGDKDVIDLIIPMMADEKHYVRKEAAKSLGRIGNSSATGVLTNALSDCSRGVRLAAAASLGKIRDETAVKPLIERYKSETDYQVRERILKSLAMIGNTEAVDAIRFITMYETDSDLLDSAKDFYHGFSRRDTD